jgi:hypothetical protein
MIYFLDEKATGSWADTALGALGYNSNPAQVQTLIRRMFELATRTVSIPGTEVIPFPLFDVLNGKDTTDYRERVEPSPSGGSKMASALLDSILNEPTPTSTPNEMVRS